MKKTIYLAGIFATLVSCNNDKMPHDASGTFEATEIIVSSEVPGKLLVFNINEGDELRKGQFVGNIDSTQALYQKQLAQTGKKAAQVRRPDMSVQIASAQEQLAKAKFEKVRIERLLADGATTKKQLDDVNSQIAVIQKSIDAAKNTLETNISALDEESVSYDVKTDQTEDILKKFRLTAPIDGTVLNKYVEKSELVGQGTPLYKIADVKNMILRVYVVAPQLEKIKIGQAVKVFTQDKTYNGKISWISAKAEFTPKTIQTQDERQNLVYAVKIAVPNTDNLLKIGMYGDADFNNN
ncbi:MAG: HlyD family efflux transporter periplasmic adaptor subunit [Flavobacteriaceae bacterium]|jgi:HlyD family secretion protein|nr:HlyD family efflux transporter periplasmic adaptor subunit [Flavobacteriaceae bacterium]